METAENLKNNLLHNIKEIRKKHGFTIKEMGEKMGHSYTFYALIENGTNGLEFRTLCEIAFIFKMSVVEVILYPKSLQSLQKVECENCKQKDEIIKNLQDYIRLLKSTNMDK